jgi:hypothetical protein
VTTSPSLIHTYTQMNPFAAFTKAERARRYHSLPVFEKIAYGVTRLFLASKPARTFFVGYACALHCLVLVAMYVASSHHASCAGQHDTPAGLPHPTALAAAAAAAAAVAAGGGGGGLGEVGGGGSG